MFVSLFFFGVRVRCATTLALPEQNPTQFTYAHTPTGQFHFIVSIFVCMQCACIRKLHNCELSTKTWTNKAVPQSRRSFSSTENRRNASCSALTPFTVHMRLFHSQIVENHSYTRRVSNVKWERLFRKLNYRYWRMVGNRLYKANVRTNRQIDEVARINKYTGTREHTAQLRRQNSQAVQLYCTAAMQRF